MAKALQAHAAGKEPGTPACRGIDFYNEQTVAERVSLSYEHVIKEWELTRDELRQVRIGGTFPRWAEDTWRESPIALHASLRPIPSPNGRYVAEIRFVSGRRVLMVRPRQ